MSPDGDFVITWQSVVPNSDGSTSRHFRAGVLAIGKRRLPRHPVQPHGGGAVSGTFTLTTGDGVDGSHHFQQRGPHGVGEQIRTALVTLGYDPAMTVTVQTAPPRLRSARHLGRR